MLGVAPDADQHAIRAAYRQLARDHHPDRVRSSSAAGAREMPAINEAYRVLNDPGRRAVYDRALTAGPPAEVPDPRPSASEQRWDIGAQALLRPARVPWRSLLVAAGVAIFGIVALAQFGGVGESPGPDGILRSGDCVDFDPNGDAREVSCTGVDDRVVRAFNPLFDDDCPGLSEPHRDRQGMGVACVDVPR